MTESREMKQSLPQSAGWPTHRHIPAACSHSKPNVHRNFLQQTKQVCSYISAHNAKGKVKERVAKGLTVCQRRLSLCVGDAKEYFACLSKT